MAEVGTPAVRSHRPASLQRGASALPKSFEEAPIHAAAVVGYPLSDALRRLELSRSRGAVERAPRILWGAVVEM